MAATAASPRPAALRRAGPGPLVRRTIGESAVCVQVLLGAAVVLAAAERRSVLSSPHAGAFTDWFAGPLHGQLTALTRDPSVLTRDLGAALFAMLGAWLLVIAAGEAVRPGIVVGAIIALHAVFLLCPAFSLNDLFNYIGYARLDALHHVNPYVQPPLVARGDPILPYSNWHGLRSPYGPLFTVLLLPLAQLSVPAAYWTYKTIATLASLAMLAAVWACARRLGRAPAPAVAFVGLNPVVIVYALGGKHNDLLMMACVMAGALLIVSRREALGGAALAAAVAIKASAGVLAPVILLGAPRRRRAIAGAVAATVALAAMTIAAFGPHLPDVRDQGRLVSRYSLPEQIGYALGHGGADASVRAATPIILAAGVAICAVVAWRRRSWETPAGWAALLAFACLTWVMAWYVLWALPFAALTRSRALRIATVLAAVWAVAFVSGFVLSVEHHYGMHLGRTATGRASDRFMIHLTNPTATSGQPRQTRIAARLPHARRPRRAHAAQPFDRPPLFQRGGERRGRPSQRRGSRRAYQRRVRDHRRRRRQH